MVSPTYEALEARLSRRELIVLDGGSGTHLQTLGFVPTMPLWSARALLECPELVRRMHDDYLDVGAEILITNTYRTSRRAFRKAGLESWREATLLAACLAIEARGARAGAIAVAGSLGALEGSYDPSIAPTYEEALREYGEIAAALAEGGVDFLVVETMNNLSEARGALEAGCATGLPTWVSCTCRADGTLYSGETMEDAARALEPLGARALLVNCTPPDACTRALRALSGATALPTGVYANLGSWHPPLWRFDEVATPEAYAHHAREWIALGARIIGGCCGTTPAHVRAVAELARA